MKRKYQSNCLVSTEVEPIMSDTVLCLHCGFSQKPEMAHKNWY